MKKLIPLFMAAVTAFSFSACSPKTEGVADPKVESAEVTKDKPVEERVDSAGKDNSDIVIGMSMNALDEYQTEWYKYFEERSKEVGAQVMMTNAEGKVDKQIADIESLIVKKVDVVLIRATDGDGVIPAAEACMKAGIPVVDSEFGINTDTLDMQIVGASQFDQGKYQADWLDKWLQDNPDEVANIGYIWGIQGSSAVADRRNGFVETILEKYKDTGRVNVLAEKTANWSATEAMTLTEDWLQAYPEMNVIAAASDEMAIGATNVLTAKNVDFSKFKVIGLDGSPNAQQKIKEGSLAMTVYTSKRTVARATVDLAIELAKGKTFDAYTQNVGEGSVWAMDATNVDEIAGK